MAAPLTQDAAQFVTSVSQQTGIDPRVLTAWVEAEDVQYATTGSNPSGTGHHNYLNLRPYTGDPYTSVSPGGFEQFSGVSDAVTATVRRLLQPFAAPIISAAKAKATPATEISAIASTGWDAGHYGGPGGPGLRSVFASIFGQNALSSGYQGSATGGNVPTGGMPGSDTFPGLVPGLTAGGGTSDQAGGGGGCSAIGHVSVVGVHIPYPDVACIAERTVSAVYAPIRPIIDKIVYFFQHIGNYLQRFGLILAGGILILIGLFKLTGGSVSDLAAAVPAGA